MASKITFQTIDGTYPVAGVDNDTQGFRDNFTIIKNSLGTAQAEITALQERALLKDPLPDTDLVNNLNGNNIADANLQIYTEQFLNVGTVTSAQNISFLNGHFQNIILNLPEVGSGRPSITFNLSDWPETGRYARMRVQFYSVPGLTEPMEVSFTVEGGGQLKIKENMEYPVIIDRNTNAITSPVEESDQGSPKIVEFWTYNGGNTVYANLVGTFVDA